MAWGHYRVLSNLLAKTSFLQFSTDIADDVWAMDYDGGALSLWRDQPDLGAPARVDKLRPATPICWQASDCQQQGIGRQEFVCTSEAQGPGQCLVME